MANAYVSKHSDDDILKNLLNDDSILEVQKKIKIVKNEIHGDDGLEGEFKITENYRKK